MTEPMNWTDGRGHPNEMTLADFLEGDLDDATAAAVSAHVAGCTLCRTIIEGAGPSIAVAVPRDDVAAVAHSWVLPEDQLTRLRERTVVPPAVGQLWRLRVPVDGGQVADLAVLTVVSDDVLIAVPATSDSRESTDLWTWQANVQGSDLTVAVWVSLETAIGWEALDVCLGSVDVDNLARVHRAVRRGQEPPADLPMGRPVDDELTQHRRQLQERFAVIGDARLIPLYDEPDEDDAVDAVTAMEEAGWGLAKVVDIVQVTAAEARKVRERTRQLSAEELARVRAVLGNVSAGPTRLTLVRGWADEVAKPSYRSRFEAVAAARRVDDWQFRAAEAVQPAAARGNRGDAEDWAALVEQRLAALEAETPITD